MTESAETGFGRLTFIDRTERDVASTFRADRLARVRMGFFAAALLLLGASLANADGSELLLRLGLIAAAMFSLIGPRVAGYLVVPLALAGVVGELLLGSLVDGVLLASAIVVLCVLGARISVSLARPQTGVQRLGGGSFDSAVAAEFTRARRYRYALTALSIHVRASERGARPSEEDVARVAGLLSRYLRQSDLLGHAGGARLMALLPETTLPEATGLLARIVAALPEGAADQIDVGVASFPEDEVTWIALQEHAMQREIALADLALAELESDRERAAI